jgi:signal transduction histidine kinase
VAAMEMGGTLTVHSDGMGTGATFTLRLPMGHFTLDHTPR